MRIARTSKIPACHVYMIDVQAFFWDDEKQMVNNRHITISTEDEMIYMIGWKDLNITDPEREKLKVNEWVMKKLHYKLVSALYYIDERGNKIDYNKWLKT